LIFTALVAHFFGSHDPLTKNKILGIGTGIIGLGFIYLPVIIQESTGKVIGVLMIIGACLSYGIGTVYVRSHLKNVPALVALAAQLMLATCLLLPLSLFIDQPFTLPTPSLQAIIGILGLGIIGTAIGFFIYYETIKVAGATYASFSVLIVPIIAMLLGALILHEELTWNLYVGGLVHLRGSTGSKPTFYPFSVKIKYIYMYVYNI